LIIVYAAIQQEARSNREQHWDRLVCGLIEEQWKYFWLIMTILEKRVSARLNRRNAENLLQRENETRLCSKPLLKLASRRGDGAMIMMLKIMEINSEIGLRSEINYELAEFVTSIELRVHNERAMIIIFLRAPLAAQSVWISFPVLSKFQQMKCETFSF
jgi:hypothetical protein